MPTHKDFKRLVRARMKKTGESYTAARGQLLHKPPDARPRLQTEDAGTPENYAALAGMSDAAVKAQTGCTWTSWVTVLDAVKAYQWPHGSIAEYVREKYHVGNWWTQTVTVGYERIRGLRDLGQRRDGAYNATKSKTFNVPLGRLYRAFAEPRMRRRWIAGVDLAVRKATRDRSMRITWDDGTSVDVGFFRKARTRSQVQVECTRLPSKDAAVEKKRYWEDRLGALEKLLSRL